MFEDLFQTNQQPTGQVQTSYDRLPRTYADSLPLPQLSRKHGYPIGLKNQGATCYLNSLLQILYHTPQLRKSILSLPLCENSPYQKTNFLNQKKHKFMLGFQRLFSEMALKDTYGLDTEYLKQAFGWQGTQHIVQHDIQQAMKIIFDTFERALIGTQFQKNIRDLFKGISSRYKSCRKCQVVDERVEQFYGLNLQVQNNQTLQQSVINLLVVEAMEGDNKIYCQHCQSKQDMWLGTKFKVLPNVLVFTLTRFTFDYVKLDRIKLTNYFSFNLEYNFAYLVQEPVDTEYQLYGVLIHRGSAHSGHYLCYIRDLMQQSDWQKGLQETQNQQLKSREKQQKQKQPTLTKQQKKRREEKARQQKCYQLLQPQNKGLLKNWFELNDSLVTAIEAKKLTSKYQGGQSAYILFYRKKGLPLPVDIKIPEYFARVIRAENEMLKKQREEYEIKKNQIKLIIDGNQQTIMNSMKIHQLLDIYCPFGYSLVNEVKRNGLAYYPIEISSQMEYLQTDTVKLMDLIHGSVWKKLQINGEEYQKIKHLISVSKIPFQINILFNQITTKMILYEDQTLRNLKSQLYQTNKIAQQDQIIKLITPFKQYFLTDDHSNNSVLLTKLGFVQGCQIVVRQIEKCEKEEEKVNEQNKTNNNAIYFVIERDDVYGIKKLYFDRNRTLKQLFDFVIESEGLQKQTTRRFRNLNGDILFNNEQYNRELEKLEFGSEIVKLRIERGEIPIKGDICIIAKMQSKYQQKSCPTQIEGIFHPNTTVLQVKKNICLLANLNPQLHRLYQTDWMGQPCHCINKQEQSIYDAKFGKEEKLCLRDAESPIGTELKIFEVFETKVGTPEDIKQAPIAIIKIKQQKTLRDLKQALLQSQLCKERADIEINRLRVRQIQRDYIFGIILRENGRLLKNYNFNTNKIAVQILESAENLNENQIVLVLKKRNKNKRVYEGHQQLIFDAGKTPSIADLYKAVQVKIGVDENEKIKLMKYVHYDYEWIEITQKKIQKILQKMKDKLNQKKKQQQDEKPVPKNQQYKQKQEETQIQKQQPTDIIPPSNEDTAGTESLDINQQVFPQKNEENHKEKRQQDAKKGLKKETKTKEKGKQESKKNKNKKKNNAKNSVKNNECIKKQDCFNLRKFPFMLKDGNWIGYGLQKQLEQDDFQTDEDLTLKLIKKNQKAIIKQTRSKEKAFKVNIDF